MKMMKINPLKILVHMTALGLFSWLVWDYLNGNLTVNPIQAATQRTGKYALILLVLSLSCTPVNTIFGFRKALTVRRLLGLYAFMFAAIHFAIFIGWDYAFNWSLLQAEIINKRYIIVGFTAGVILSVLALTSFRFWMKRLGKNWKRLHRLVYLASGLVIVHFAWVKKGDLFRLQGDIWQPLAFGLLVLILFVLRVPKVRSSLSGLPQKVRKRSKLVASSQD